MAATGILWITGEGKLMTAAEKPSKFATSKFTTSKFATSKFASWGDHIFHQSPDGRTKYPYTPHGVQYEDSTRIPGTVDAAYGMVDMRVEVDNGRMRDVLRANNFHDPTSRIPLAGITLPGPDKRPITLRDLLSDASMLRTLGLSAEFEVHPDGLLDPSVDDGEGALVSGGVMLMDPTDAGNRYDLSMKQYPRRGSLLVIAATASGTTVDFHPEGQTNLVRFRMDDGTLARWKVERFDQSTEEGRKAAFEGMHPSSEAFIITVPVEAVVGDDDKSDEAIWYPGPPMCVSIAKCIKNCAIEEEEEDTGGFSPIEEGDEDTGGFSLFDDDARSAKRTKKTILEEHGFEFLKHSLESTGDHWVPANIPRLPIRRIKDSMVRIIHRIPAAFDSSKDPSAAVLANIQKRVAAVHRDKPVMEIFGHLARMQQMQKEGRLRRIEAGQGDVATQAKAEGVVCVICCDAPLSAVSIPCGHMLSCASCAGMLDGKVCPFCRAHPIGITSEAAAVAEGIKVVAQGFV